MTNYRSSLIVFLFILITFAVSIMAQSVKTAKDSYQDLLDVEIIDESIFENMIYFAIEDNKKNIKLDADSLVILNQEKFIFKNARGTLFSEEDRDTDFTASEGDYDLNNKDLNLLDDIEFETIDGRYNADKLNYKNSQAEVHAVGSINAVIKDLKTEDTLIIKANSMKSNIKTEITYFKGDIQGELQRKRKYEGGFRFSSKEMMLNKLESLVELSKDVNLHRNNYDVEAQRAEIFLENFNKRLKYYILYDDIKFVERLKLESDQTRIRRAYAEKMEGFMAEGRIILSGAPRVEQDNDLIKGYEITLRENVELIEVDDSQSSFKLNRDD